MKAKSSTANFSFSTGVTLSITAFPVLTRILAELKLLTTQVGEKAMAAATFNDIVVWVLLALAIAVTGNGTTAGKNKSSLMFIWVLVSGLTFVAFMMVQKNFVQEPMGGEVGGGGWRWRRHCQRLPEAAASGGADNCFARRRR
uniref:Cation/H+ exchanger transmembrane domain-containing protein n=1 Tax=Nelumbo nucifera TaxID=4432 RepID=A0A822XMX7_NELNU|nr:TPA_asm: hypothetical protein HUJ06_022865 [Nelumbo nucifera]